MELEGWAEVPPLKETDIYHENHPLHHMLYEELEEYDENMNYFHSDQCQRDMKDLMK